MSKHTPGPWAVHPVKATVDGAGKSGMMPICGMLWPTDERSEEETEANADLISAAPDLLDVMKRIMDWEFDMEHGRTGFSYFPGTQAAKAIAKAEGRA